MIIITKKIEIDIEIIFMCVKNDRPAKRYSRLKYESAY